MLAAQKLGSGTKNNSERVITFMTTKSLSHTQVLLLSLVVKITDIFLYIGCGVLVFYTQAYFMYTAHAAYSKSSLFLPLRYQIALLSGAILFYPIFYFFGVYKSLRDKSFTACLQVLCVALVIIMLSLMASGFIAKVGQYYSRQWFLLWHLYALISIVFSRVLLLCAFYVAKRYGINIKQVLVVGSGELAKDLVKTAKNVPWSKFIIAAIFDNHPSSSEISGITVQPLPEDINVYIQQHKIEEIWIALSLWTKDEIEALIYKLNNSAVVLRYFPGVFGINLLDYSVAEIFGFSAINIAASPMVGVNRFVKAFEDRVLAAFILLLISPFMLLIAVLVKLSSPGQVFYRQLRHGRDGRLINIYKFRTMYVHNEPSGIVTQATSSDPRITSVGKFLRRTSLDELPQFINVLQGRMSIVGPRPHAVEHNKYYKNLISSYMLRHQVKPGITGWAQVNGWRGETNTLEKMKTRIEHDLYYINNWSLWMDVKIIFRTILYGFNNKNAY